MKSHVEVRRVNGQKKKDEAPARQDTDAGDEDRETAEDLEEPAQIHEPAVRRQARRHDPNVEVWVHKVVGARRDEERGERKKRESPSTPLRKLEHLLVS